MALARDCFWLWGHESGNENDKWGVPGASRISAIEAAYYLGIPNVIMIRHKADPLPPDRRDLVPFRRLRRVVWSLIETELGTPKNVSMDRALEVSRLLPNMVGGIMDDFFRPQGDENTIGVLSRDELRHIRTLLAAAVRPLDLWAVLYAHQLRLPVRKHLELCDKVAFWTWKAEDLPRLEENFALMEAVAPSCGKLLGCYMWDYSQKCPMPQELMKLQCELGLRWLKERRIEGMIFLGACICDLDLGAVEWTRTWLEDVGDHMLQVPNKPDAGDGR